MSIDVKDERVTAIFRSIDAMDAEGFAQAFTEDGSFRFGNAPAVHGRTEVAKAVGDFFGMIGGLRHEITGLWNGRWDSGEVRSVELEVTYTRKDGSTVGPLPAVSTLRMEGGLVKDYRIFADITPLFAQAG